MLYSLVIVCAYPFPLHYRYALIRYFSYAYIHVLKFVCHIDYVVEGLENLPKDRCGIVLCKHQSAWETFFLPILFYEPAVIIKRELLWIPFFGWGLAASEPIAIDRRNKSSAMQQVINKGRKCLEQGRWVLIFPEGTRVPYGEVGHYKLGGPRLAAATGYPVVPVAHNAGLVWPRRKFIKQPGTVHIIIGPMIESEGRTPEEILNRTKGWIESTMLRIDSLVKKPAR